MHCNMQISHTIGRLMSTHLGYKWDDSDSRVAADDRTGDVVDVEAFCFGDEGVGPDDVQGSDAEDARRVVDAAQLEDLGDDGNRRVHLEDFHILLA